MNSASCGLLPFLASALERCPMLLRLNEPMAFWSKGRTCAHADRRDKSELRSYFDQRPRNPYDTQIQPRREGCSAEKQSGQLRQMTAHKQVTEGAWEPEISQASGKEASLCSDRRPLLCTAIVCWPSSA